MAGIDKAEELIAYLKSLGFEGKIFEANIREGYNEGRPFMSVDHRIPFGDEMMRYTLRFVYDRQFMAYRLEGYDAWHRLGLTIDHKNINGIDTGELEQSMAEIDWGHYFHCEMNDIKFDEDLMPLFEKLWKLSDEDNPHPEGEKIQSKLIYKYWPYGNWNDEADSLQFVYETKKTFNATEYGICNATLAFNIVSERLNNLHELIKKTGIEQYPGVDLKNLLANYLSNNSDGFEVSCSFSEEEGVIDFRIPVQKVEQDYHAGENHVTFISFPEVKHGVFNGINSHDLEIQMKRIDWKTDSKIIEFKANGDTVLLPHIRAIVDLIAQLDEHEQSREIADYLKVKYWSDSFMEIYAEDDTWLIKDWQRIRQRFSLEDDCKTISNLMRGRPVHAKCFKSYEYDLEGWFVIDPAGVADKGLNPMEFVPRLTRAQLETMVQMLPLDGTAWVGDIVRSISQGEHVPLNLIGVGGQQKVIVAANPKEQKLDLLSADGKTIPFNFRLDPDWQPELPQHLGTDQSKARAARNQSVKRIKGIGKSPKR